MNRQSNGYDDDIDDIMASIMHDTEKPGPRQVPQARSKNQQITVHTKNVPSKRSSHSNQTHNKEKEPSKENTSIKDNNQDNSNTHKRHPGSKSKKIRILLPLVILLGVASIIGFSYLKEPLLALFKPKTPFSTEVTQKSEAMLYYPTKLPGSFKMETNSISQSDNGIVLYVITDDSGKKINVTIQKKPDNLNLDPLYAALSDVRELPTKLDAIKIGQSTENDPNLEIANVVIENTWIIISSQKGTVTDQDLITIINSLTKS